MINLSLYNKLQKNRTIFFNANKEAFRRPKKDRNSINLYVKQYMAKRLPHIAVIRRKTLRFDFNLTRKKWKSDPVFGSYWVAKFITKLTKCGKKEKAENHFAYVYSQLAIYLRNRHPLVIYLNILKLLATPLTLITKRVGKNFYKIPIPLKPYNSYIKALTWFFQSVQERKETKIRARILGEIITLMTNRRASGAIQRRKTFYGEVYYNRVYAHYRWV